ncbi:hypothetical protein BDN72DRAFT_838126 [Pluteus cervinus]|uniref:Uncharacterized protein n=1 Tax=Pluteus cervinus TaxID=181527 RepID=A0ACD3AZI6_9AGAR|nr:hypothetical protein BDN72DRAFT_838126 [Pluteus cervinus]
MVLVDRTSRLLLNQVHFSPRTSQRRCPEKHRSSGTFGRVGRFRPRYNFGGGLSKHFSEFINTTIDVPQLLLVIHRTGGTFRASKQLITIPAKSDILTPQQISLMNSIPCATFECQTSYLSMRTTHCYWPTFDLCRYHVQLLRTSGGRGKAWELGTYFLTFPRVITPHKVFAERKVIDRVPQTPVQLPRGQFSRKRTHLMKSRPQHLGLEDEVQILCHQI